MRNCSVVQAGNSVNMKMNTDKENGPEFPDRPLYPGHYPPHGQPGKSSFDGMPESEIWKAFQAGNEAAFNFIYRSYVQELFNFGCHLLHDPDAVMDLIHDIFVRFRGRKEESPEVWSIKAYLYKVLYHEAIRLGTARRKHSIFSYEKSEMEGRFAVDVSFETKLIREEMDSAQREILTKALNQLTERQRKALLLFYEEGFSYEEIAGIMDLKETKYARKLIYRAIQCAQRVIRGKWGFWGGMAWFLASMPCQLMG